MKQAHPEYTEGSEEKSKQRGQDSQTTAAKDPTTEEFSTEKDPKGTQSNSQLPLDVAASTRTEPVQQLQAQEPPSTPSLKGITIETNEPWANIWNKMNYEGWSRQTGGRHGDFIFTKPDKKVRNGVEGTDYFASLATVQAYVHCAHPYWQPPMAVKPPAVAPKVAETSTAVVVGM